MEKTSDLRELLDEACDRFNRPEFIETDPIQVPHGFSKKEDIEISAFLTALIAWGRRDIILRSAHGLMDRFDREPYNFIRNASSSELDRLDGFVHRTFQGIDARALVLGLREVYTQHGGLEAIFSANSTENGLDEAAFHAIVNARTALSARPDFPGRTHKHLANPAKGSSAKRINMFLRWMVRNDGRGVDFGLWKNFDPAALMLPLDVHTGKVARKLGLLERKQNDWRAVREVTQNLRRFSPQDPIRYDFSLFGLGVSGAL